MCKQFVTLRHLWSHANIDNKLKLRVYEAILPPMATYALD